MDIFDALRLGRTLPQDIYDGSLKLHAFFKEISEVKQTIAKWGILPGFVGMCLGMCLYAWGIRLGPPLSSDDAWVPFLVQAFGLFCLAGLIGFGLAYHRYRKELRRLYRLFKEHREESETNGERWFFPSLQVIYKLKPGMYERTPHDVRKLYDVWLSSLPRRPRLVARSR